MARQMAVCVCYAYHLHSQPLDLSENDVKDDNDEDKDESENQENQQQQPKRGRRRIKKRNIGFRIIKGLLQLLVHWMSNLVTFSTTFLTTFWCSHSLFDSGV